MTHAALWIGGEPPVPEALINLPAFDVVLAADSGFDAASATGVGVDVLVGDMDSVTPQHLNTFGGEVLRFPPDKDYTDLELALDVATERGATDIMVIGGGGGRLDHELSSLLVLTLEKYAGARITARIGRAEVLVVRDRVELRGTPDEVVSLVPARDVVDGVTTSGLRWPLELATLRLGATWSVSNEFTGTAALIEVNRGVLLVVRPAAFG